MKAKKVECNDFQSYITPKGNLETKCRKHYCICLDRFLWDEELDKRYQEAKKNGRAESGIFFD